jgi:carbon-monoxide dehydrogenase small subunit
MKTPLVTLSMTVNGVTRRVRTAPMKRLLDVLREDCGLTGTKEGCGEGECGACTVLMDGRAVNACLVPAVQAAGARIVTVEGLAKGPRLSALQQAFLAAGGAQCGICTPGMLVTSMELLGRTKGRVPREDEVRTALSGNLCRCTGYQKIVDAVRLAATVGRREATARARARNRAKAEGAPRRATTQRAKAKGTPKRATAKRAISKRATPKRSARRAAR